MFSVPRSPWLRRLLTCPPDALPPDLAAYRAGAAAGLSLMALARQAGYTPGAVRYQIRRGLAGQPVGGWTSARCLAAGRAAVAHHGPGIRSATAWAAAGLRPHRHTIVRHFGSWAAFWAQATPALPPVPRGRPPRKKRPHDHPLDRQRRAARHGHVDA
jgi:hypothetical protein